LRLHPIALLFLLLAAFKAAALAIDMAGLSAAVIAMSAEPHAERFEPLAPALGSLAWIIRELAEVGAIAGWGLAIEAASRIYGRLVELNRRDSQGELGV
jgi:hypothetical protein